MNVYEIVTERILDQLNKGVIPWRKTGKGSEPVNYASRKGYRGVNLLLLPFGGEYLTYKQAIDAGGNVRKGEKPHMVVFWRMLEKENLDNGKKEEIPFLRYSNVFHISQCDGIESKLPQVMIDETIKPSAFFFVWLFFRTNILSPVVVNTARYFKLRHLTYPV